MSRYHVGSSWCQSGIMTTLSAQHRQGGKSVLSCLSQATAPSSVSTMAPLPELDTGDGVCASAPSPVRVLYPLFLALCSRHRDVAITAARLSHSLT